ncbi:unnamed protein product [Echinostoma caproni]|uniref:Sorting nexin-3 n=1 Tax=Echinostoma caproni TaxID=27848 RepID=A0A3P8LCL4_9TREM|nr:unnamed protein product [Echinostoma caproni]
MFRYCLQPPSVASATQRLAPRRQTIEDAYSPPANFLEIDVCRPLTHGEGKNRYTDYEVNLRTNLPIFALKESSVRRRYSDFEWLRNELDRESKVIVNSSLLVNDHDLNSRGIFIAIMHPLCRFPFLSANKDIAFGPVGE